MNRLFDLIIGKDKDKGVNQAQLGVRLQIGGNEAVCPVSRICVSLEEFEVEVRSICDELERLKETARRVIGPKGSPSGLNLGPDASPQDVWKALCALQDEDMMVSYFNQLETEQRQAVAEYVLTHCNVFSGKGAVFSRRYDAETGLMG
jgi:hypothetical protein